MEYTELNKIPGIMVLIDFGISGIIKGGYVANYFKVSRGVRQGCPLSPISFILAAELLAQTIRQSSKSKGIKFLSNVEFPFLLGTSRLL